MVCPGIGHQLSTDALSRKSQETGLGRTFAHALTKGIYVRSTGDSRPLPIWYNLHLFGLFFNIDF